MKAASDQGQPESQAKPETAGSEPVSPSPATQPAATQDSGPDESEATAVPRLHEDGPKEPDVDDYYAARTAALSQIDGEQPKQGKPASAEPADELEGEDQQTAATPGKTDSPVDPADPAADPAEGDEQEDPANPDKADLVDPIDSIDPAANPSAAPEARKDFRPRLNKLDPIEQEAIALRRDLADKGEKLSLKECIERVEGKYKPTAAEASLIDQAADAAPDDPQTRPVEEIDAALAEARKKRNDAIRLMDADAQIAAEDAIDALKDERSECVRASERRARETAERETAKRQNAVNENVEKVNTFYPASLDTQHPINAKADAIFAVLRKTGNPKLSEPDCVWWVYERAANELGIVPVDPDAPTAEPAVTKSSTSGPPAKPQPVQRAAAPVPGRKPALAPSGARTAPTGPSATESLKNIRTPHEYAEHLEKMGVR